MMLSIIRTALCFSFFFASLSTPESFAAKEAAIYDFTLPELGGKTLPLAQYKGQVLLIVNTASECGYTKQLGGLEKLYQEEKSRGLVVLGIPSDSFHQELSDEAAVGAFCKKNFGVSFPMSRILEVKGDRAHPLIRFLVEKAPASAGSEVQWNFEKFLVDRKGKVAGRFRSAVTPEDQAFKNTVARLLAEKSY